MELINALIKNTLTLKLLFQNRGNYEKYFPDNYIPTSKVIDGDFYVKKYEEVIPVNVANAAHIIRPLFTDLKGNIIDDGSINSDNPDSIFFKVPDEGYMFLLIWERPFLSGNYFMSYIIDINSINVDKNFNTVKEGVNIGLIFQTLDIDTISFKVAENIRTQVNDPKLMLDKYLKKCL